MMRSLKNNWITRVFYSLLSFSIIISSCHPQEEHPEPIAQPQPEPDVPKNQENDCITRASADNGSVIQGEYIIKYKQDGEDMTISAYGIPDKFLTKFNISEKTVRHLFSGKFKAFAAKLTKAQVDSLQRDVSVESIEPDKVISIVSCYSSIDKQTFPWGVKRVGNGNGSGKTAWIIDTGIDLDHPDLHVDVLRSKSFIKETTPEDDHGHGTHVAGIIAAKDNQIGVVGVAANAKVVSLKVMNHAGKGSTSRMIEAVNYVALHGKAGDVVNMSVSGDPSEILDNAIIDAADKGIYFSIAAGNYSSDASLASPARVNHPNVFTISAMDDQDTWATFSNYGATSVDFCAPGVNITSTHLDGAYATMSGTSMAAPHMAGLLLLNGRKIMTDGFVKNDPDENPDPIPHK